jgi:RimJ/RimL family protein N-acetyltransferase
MIKIEKPKTRRGDPEGTVLSGQKKGIIMEIRRSRKNDIDEIMKIFENARKFMKDNGNPNQWRDSYPEKSLIESDIENNVGFVCLDEGEIVGTFIYFEGKEPTYAEIYDGQWLNDEPYGVVHRVASKTGKGGVASFCLNWCFEKCRNLKIDTHRDNIPMHNLLIKLGFVRCGIIYLENGDERIAYQKIEGE